jgi:hypothetical protein
MKPNAPAPTYAHFPGVAAGTCGRCAHRRGGGEVNGIMKKSWCQKAVEFARYPGEGAPIDPAAQGCKYWEFKP